MESNQPSEDNQELESLVSLKDKYEEGAKMQVELQEKVDSAKFIVTYCSAYNRDKNNHKKELEELKELGNIDLTGSLYGKEYDMEFERLLDPDKIVGNIKKIQMNLKCSECDCPNMAEMVYINEDLDLIYCKYHSNQNDHQTKPLKFEYELNDCESRLNDLEKKLLYVQKQMTKIRNEDFSFYPNSSNNKKLEELENTFYKLKNTLNSLWIRVESFTKNENSKTMNKEEKNKYLSLDFIQEECKKCSILCSEIDSTISEMQKDKEIDFLIQSFVNSHKGEVEFKEESKFCQFLKVPSEIYGKKFKVVDNSIQSIISLKKYEDKIK